jgi:(p)ppGpp synthase/HD superfamily hydrolase
MHVQTNVQLFVQLQRQGYSTEELSLVRDAYGLAVQLFTGLHRPSGKTFMDHVVGTASILVALHQSGSLIAAALIHAAYEHGDFGSGTKGISERKRQQVRQALGEQVEAYVAQYTALRWNSRTIQPVYDRFHSLAPMDRDVLLIRLANELDDLRDLGVLYCLQAESKRRRYLRFGPTLVEMAEKLGFPALAAELTRALAETASAEIFAELRSRKPGVVLFAPRSYCRRPGTVLLQAGSRARKRLRQLRHRVFRFRSMAGIKRRS